MRQPTNIRTYLDQANKLKKLVKHGQWLLQVQNIVCSGLDEELAKHCHVAQLQENTLTLLADHGATASRLRQITPSICYWLAQRNIIVHHVKIKVRLQYSPARIYREQPAPREIGSKGRHSIEQFCQTLQPDDPLRQTMQKLLQVCQN